MKSIIKVDFSDVQLKMYQQICDALRKLIRHGCVSIKNILVYSRKLFENCL